MISGNPSVAMGESVDDSPAANRRQWTSVQGFSLAGKVIPTTRGATSAGRTARIVTANPIRHRRVWWYLLAEKTAASMHKQIEEGKKKLTQAISPQELAEAEHRAAERLNNLKSQSTSASVCLVPSKKTLTGVP